MPPGYIEELYKLKLASRDIVEAVKGTKHLQKNMLKYTSSKNEYIKEQYNDIRKGLAELLRNINSIATTDEEDVISLLLSKAKIHTKRYDIITNGTLDKLIRKGLITNTMATSLMNDSDYANNISKNLIRMAEVLFIDINSDLKKLHKDISINDKEVDSMLDKKG
jgi:phosphate:Na+ symporter